MGKQHTLAAEIAFAGKGLHLGEEANVTVHPGEPDSGFRLRSDEHEIALSPDIADGSKHRTIMSTNGVEVHTIEHLLAALFGMGVDNAVIEINGPEIPGMDGSAKIFAEQIAEVGLVEQDAAQDVFTLSRPISVAEGDAGIMAYPSKQAGLRITYILDYAESAIACGMTKVEVTPETMLAEISPCRTFAMKCHAEAMREQGMGKGANTVNTIILDGDTVLDNELRFPDECARHKILDLIGDLASLARPLSMEIVANKSGHGLNLKLASALQLEMRRVAHPKGIMDIRKIEKTLPHRYPFLLVDRILEIEPWHRIRALKNVSRNEEFFQGHFPGQPIMPGVLQVEALAQAGGVLMTCSGGSTDKLAVLMGIDDVKFRRPVVPGDQLDLEVVFEKIKGRIGIVQATARVAGDVVTQAWIKFALVDPEQYT